MGLGGTAGETPPGRASQSQMRSFGLLCGEKREIFSFKRKSVLVVSGSRDAVVWAVSAHYGDDTVRQALVRFLLNQAPRPREEQFVPFSTPGNVVRDSSFPTSGGGKTYPDSTTAIDARRRTLEACLRGPLVGTGRFGTPWGSGTPWDSVRADHRWCFRHFGRAGRKSVWNCHALALCT